MPPSSRRAHRGPTPTGQPNALVAATNELEIIIRAVRQAAKIECVVGVLEEDSLEPKTGLRDGGTTRYTDYTVTLGQVVLQNEFGGVTTTGARIPARPALRNTADTLFHYAAYRTHEQWDPWTQPDPGFWMHDLGQAAVPITKTNIERWQDPPNAMFTIENKGKDDPLIATRQYVDSVNFQVRRKQSEKVAERSFQARTARRERQWQRESRRMAPKQRKPKTP